MKISKPHGLNKSINLYTNLTGPPIEFEIINININQQIIQYLSTGYGHKFIYFIKQIIILKKNQ